MRAALAPLVVVLTALAAASPAAVAASPPAAGAASPPAAGAASRSAALAERAPAARPARDPLSPPLQRTPRLAAGTVILVPGSGWSGPSPAAQRSLFHRLSGPLVGARRRAVAIDYAGGAVAGLASVEQAVAAERGRARGPLCLYGESSGGHLALLAAQRLAGVDCVVTAGAPTSFSALASSAAAQPERPGYAWLLEHVVGSVFGADPLLWAPWEPARRPMRQPVLMMMAADDPIVPLDQLDQLPGAETFVPPPGDPRDPADAWMHGTATAAGREAALRRILQFVSRPGAAAA